MIVPSPRQSAWGAVVATAVSDAVPGSSPLLIGNVAGKAGYRSILMGKTHVILNRCSIPCGFDEGMFSHGEKMEEKNPYPQMQNVRDSDFWSYNSFMPVKNLDLLTGDQKSERKSLDKIFAQFARVDVGPVPFTPMPPSQSPRPRNAR